MVNKNIAVLFSIFIVLTIFSGCGSTTTSTDVKVETPQFVEATNDVTPSASIAEDSSDASETMETAKKFINKDVSELFAAIGQPSSSDYAPSCLGSGEDGELYYDGFTVATYKEGNSETVIDVF